MTPPPRTPLWHPRMGHATVEAQLGQLLRLRLANGEDMLVTAEDVARQWSGKPPKLSTRPKET